MCVGAGISALIGWGFDLGYQLLVEGKSLDRVNWGQVLGSTVAGAIAGGTFGLGSSVAATTLLAISAGAVAGQASALTEGFVNEGLRAANQNDGFKVANAFEVAKQAGLGNIRKAAIDASANLIATGVAKVVGPVVDKAFGAATSPANKPIAVFEPSPSVAGGWKNPQVKQFLGYSRAPTKGEQTTQAIARFTVERITDTLAEYTSRMTSDRLERKTPR